jgi:hypothetical protein
MKKLLSIIGIVALISFGCSNEDATNFEEANLKLEKKSSASSLNKLLKSEKFKDYLLTKSKQNNDQSKANGNGLMILSDGYNVGFGGFSPDWTSIMLIGGTGTIEKMPNGRAKFSVHTNSPDAFFLDFYTWSGVQSDCVDSPRGSFNYNFISEYTVEVWDWDGTIFTFYTPTGENSSASSGNGHCKVSDALPIYDWDTFEQIGCSDATDTKTIRLKGNAQKGYSISMN